MIGLKRLSFWLAAAICLALAACAPAFLGAVPADSQAIEEDPVVDSLVGTLNPADSPGLLMLGRSRFTPTAKPARHRSATPAVSYTPLETYLASEASDTPIPAITSTPAFQICSPIQGVPVEKLNKLISDPYHPPPMGSDARHQGVDFANYRFITGYQTLQGVPVQAVLAGKVAASEAGTFPFGNVVIVETPYDDLPLAVTEALQIPQGTSLYILYAHMDAAPLVQRGEEVAACQVVGAVGKSGNTDATHLHLETRTGVAATVFEGFGAFTDTATEQDKKNYRLWRVSGVFLHFDPMLLFALAH